MFNAKEQEQDYLSLAFKIALSAHKGQKDKSGKEYITHCIRVSKKGTTENEKIVGVLHDVVEDTSITLEDLRRAGFSSEIIAAVDAITKRKGGEILEAYLARVKENPLALAVKLHDIEDNSDPERLESLSEEERRRLITKYEFAKRFLLNGHSLQD